ncbi:MAG: prephenate dehydrogenase/arogenate dehydrogenase family protein [Victivallales bacterium]|nr:prephenate dehydrogenase/arogenate dehydrogenase family protein [Victivallales bacterium]
MNIGIIGLGLIGGSLAKATKRFTTHPVYVWNRTEATAAKALAEHAADGILDVPEDFAKLDLMILALYPEATIEFVRSHLHELKPGAVIVDTCGTKTLVCRECQKLVASRPEITFIGGHPMAGIEQSGYDASRAELFVRASMLLVPSSNVDKAKLQQVAEFFLSLGFGATKVTAAETHDRVIAYTSQLAHLVASAYIKSPAALKHPGFSAGSFRDMTRVAFLQEAMWTELFLENQEFLLPELDRLLGNLTDFRNALAGKDKGMLLQLLRDGKERKIQVNNLPEEPYSPF